MGTVAKNANDQRISEKFPNRIHPKKFMPRYTIIKFLKTKNRKILKALSAVQTLQ